MTLVIACGNPLRGDDGVGAKVADALQGGAEACTVITVHALLPELAESVARASRVVFVDARLGAVPGRVSTDAVSATAVDTALQGHGLTPGGVVGLATQLYGWRGDAWLVSIEAGEFGYGAALSAPVAAAVPAAVAAVVSRIVSR